ncbi:MAG: SufD family Fe-S cluster assembly protein [Anaerolineales bacterium]|nr:SufD family Fe-S cluster assembly protein [Anaerolineales bacterium]MDW8161875.1 SufD family Fe-S cluster assembly protein [Anaerolineales bacterium]
MSAVVKLKHASEDRPGWVSEMAALLEAYRQAGGEPAALQLPQVATLVVSSNTVLMSHEVPGIHFDAEPLENGVKATIRVEPNAKIEHPVHLCFGVIPAEGVQKILANYEIGHGAEVRFLAHCSFPNAVRVQHLMEGTIYVGKNASLTYTEEHFHGQMGGVEVLPRVKVSVDEGGRFTTTFVLTRGRIGKMVFDYEVEAGKCAVVEMTTKAYGHGDDEIVVKEVVHLNGEKARGLTRTRVAVRDRARSQVFTTMEGNAPGARGHMDCTEIVRDQAVAQNTPLVIVRNDQAQVTHEAAIGSVNRKELEALLARGLDEDEAVDLIIRGMIR